MRKTRFLAIAVAVFTLIGCGGSDAEVVPFGPEAKAMNLRRCGATFDNLKQLECYTQHFERVRTTEGVDTALDELVEWHLNPEGGPFATHCHETLHRLGVAEMTAAGTEAERIDVFTKARITCTGGYVHGALTQYYEGISAEELRAQYRTMCTTLIDSVSAAIGVDADATGWLSWNCNHMLGHALYTNNPENLVEAAALCADFDDGTDQRLGCEAGFFMEHFLVMGRTPGLSGYTATPTQMMDVHRLCNDVDAAVAQGCWSESGGMVYITAGREWAAAGAACLEYAPNAETLESCYEGLGRNIAPYAGYEPAQMETWCREIGDQFAVEICAIQIAGSQAMELNRVEAGLAVCASMVRDQDRRERCEEGVNRTGDQLAGSGFEGGVGTWDR